MLQIAFLTQAHCHANGTMATARIWVCRWVVLWANVHIFEVSGFKRLALIRGCKSRYSCAGQAGASERPAGIDQLMKRLGYDGADERT